MKVFAIASIALVAAATPMQVGATTGEIGYDRGALGYDALVAGDNQAAIRQIEMSDSTAQNDPARLINLAIAHYRTGQTAQALALFDEAARAENVQLVVAGGKVMNSRAIAHGALSAINSRLAVR